MHPLLPWLLLVLAACPAVARGETGVPPAPVYAPSGAPAPDPPVAGNDPSRVHPAGSQGSFQVAEPVFPDDYPDPSLSWTWTVVLELGEDGGATRAAWHPAGETTLTFACGSEGRSVRHRYAWVFGTAGHVQALSERSEIPERVWCESDADAIRDDLDICPDADDPEQCDTDGDGLGNACDADLDGDGVVGLPDFNVLRRAWDSAVGGPRYDPDADFDCDGQVGLPDFNAFRSRLPGVAEDPPNRPVDRDGDGLPDTIYVTPDFDPDDGGGRLRTDVQAAYALLTDPDTRHLRVGAGVYECPDVIGVGRGCLDIGSHTLLECDPGAVLRGQDVTHTAEYRPVVHDDDSPGLTDVTVRGCEVDGGMPRGFFGTATGGGSNWLEDASASWPPGHFDGVVTGRWVVLRPEGPERETRWISSNEASRIFVLLPWDSPPAPGDDYLVGFDGAPLGGGVRRGIDIGPVTGVSDVVIEDNFVHDTYHACIYSKNGTRVTVRNNRVERCGTFFAVQGQQSQPGIYLFADNGNTLSEVTVVGNHARFCAASGINTRRKTPGDAIERLWIVGNTIEQAVTGKGLGPAGINLAGLRDSIVSDNVATGGRTWLFIVSGGGWDDAFPAPSRNLIVDRLTGTDLSRVPGAIGFTIGRHQTGLRLRHLHGSGTPEGRECMSYAAPQRDAVLEDVVLERCGGHGLISGTTAYAWGSEPDTALVIRRLLIDGTDVVDRTDATRYFGIHIRGGDGTGLLPAVGSLLEDVTVRDATAAGIRFESGLRDSLIANVDVDMLPSGYRGAMGEAQAATEVCDDATRNQWLITTDSSGPGDCDFGSGAGAVENACVCDGASFVDMPLDPRPQCMLWEGAADGGNTVSDFRCANVVGSTWGIEIEPNTSNTLFERVTAVDEKGTSADLDMRGALRSDGAAVTTQDVVCIDTYAGTPCVD